MRPTLGVGAVLGFLSVAFGAFGAHALKAQIPPDRLEIFQTGVHYQAIHALAILMLAVVMRDQSDRLLLWVRNLFLAGVVIFSGSLYALALSGVRMWGAVTPVGGVCFLTGWALLAVYGFRNGESTTAG